MSRPLDLGLLICGFWGLVALIGFGLWALVVHRDPDQEPLQPGEIPHESASLTSPAPAAPPAPIEFDEPPVGRHHEDTVEVVPPDYRPDIGRRRFARETETQRLELPK